MPAQAFKSAAAGITREYFSSQDTEDAASSLKGLKGPQYMELFVKQACLCCQCLLLRLLGRQYS